MTDHLLRSPAGQTTCVGVLAGELLLTIDGLVPASKLQPGDQLALHDGSVAPVSTCIHQESVPAVRLDCSDGASTAVSSHQPLSLLHRYGHRREWTPIQLLTADLLSADLRRGPEYRYRIPLIQHLDLPARPLPVDPYVLGNFLANGHAGSSIAITAPDPVVIERLTCAGGRLIGNNTGTVPRVLMPKTIGKIRELGVAVHSKNKFIPDMYATASYEQRLDLLHGLMDGDGGGSNKGRSCTSYYSTSYRLAVDVAHLVNSLGGTGTISSTDRTHEGKGIEYRVSIMLPPTVDPFFSTRKKRGVTVRKTGPGRALVGVEALGPQPVVAVATDAEGGGLAVVGRSAVLVPIPSAGEELAAA